MKLIIILISLGLDRFLNVGQMLKRFCWLDAYMGFLEPILKKVEALGRLVQLVIVILPIALIVGLLIWALSDLWMGIVAFVLGIGVVIYCLGPDELNEQVEQYASACQSNDDQAINEVGEKLLVTEPTQEDSHNSQSITEAIFVQANTRYFAVLFWFLIFGPFAAIVYRMVALLGARKQYAVSEVSESCMKILDWIPARIAAFSFLLVGQFMGGFSQWWRHCGSGLDSNDEILSNCGLAAVGFEVADSMELQPEDIKKAMRLIDRGLVVWVVVVALITFGGWFL